MTLLAGGPAISVVLPVRNGGGYLDAALGSIERQTFGDWELIIVDDRSTDATQGIIDQQARRDPRVKACRTEGGGLIDALNTGVTKARAPLIARMDADDLARPQRLERQLAAFEKRPDLLVLGGQVRHIDSEGGKLGTGRYPVGTVACRKQSLFSSPLCHAAVMMRTDAVRHLSGYRRSYRHAEDYDLWLRFAEVGEIDNLHDTLLDYRIHPKSVTSLNLHTQSMNAALARLAADARARGEGDPTPAPGWQGETIEEVCKNHSMPVAVRRRAVLAYWRALVLSGGFRNLNILLEFRERLSDLAEYAVEAGELEAFASLTLRAAYLAGRAGSPLMSAQYLAWSISSAPGAAARDIAGWLGARLDKPSEELLHGLPGVQGTGEL
jgi:glycosyltransferase involved in cell wall biosynthesis